MNYKPYYRISCDIDGCLADFETGYLRRFKKWPNHDWAITRNVAHILVKERDFWLNLPVLNTLNFTPKMYCSARLNNRRWTKKYLEDNGFPKAPLYQVPGYHLSKAKTLKGRCDVHIEDSMKNFLDLNSKGIHCLLYNTSDDISPVLQIKSLDVCEIEEVHNIALEMNVYDAFNEIFNL